MVLILSFEADSTQSREIWEQFYINNNEFWGGFKENKKSLKSTGEFHPTVAKCQLL